MDGSLTLLSLLITTNNINIIIKKNKKLTNVGFTICSIRFSTQTKIIIRHIK